MITNLQATTINQFGTGQEVFSRARRIACKFFERAYGRGKRHQLLAKLTGKANELQTLSCQPAASHRSIGIVVVSLSQIVGSESRSKDFDAHFNPLKRNNRERWIGIAAARRTGVALPAVELVKTGDGYYVRDGHHRISVAKAMGQLEIEARVVN